MLVVLMVLYNISVALCYAFVNYCACGTPWFASHFILLQDSQSCVQVLMYLYCLTV